jgi:tripartite-type tricarboxylate transporter receptor subunit TctC
MSSKSTIAKASIPRRHFALTAACLLAGSLAGSLVHAQAPAPSPWPTRPITLVVPFVAGGGTDIGTRIVGQRLSQILGQSVVIDNRAARAATWRWKRYRAPSRMATRC